VAILIEWLTDTANNFVGKGRDFRSWSTMWKLLSPAEKLFYRQEALLLKGTAVVRNDQERASVIRACMKIIGKQVNSFIRIVY